MTSKFVLISDFEIVALLVRETVCEECNLNIIMSHNCDTIKSCMTSSRLFDPLLDGAGGVSHVFLRGDCSATVGDLTDIIFLTVSVISRS